MLENIKRIGLFMIVAQTLIHFAAGPQYEKYMKVIAGVIILLLFVQPFSGAGQDLTGQWQREMSRLLGQAEEAGGSWRDHWETAGQEGESGMTERLERQFEEEIKETLNRKILSEDYIITNVTVHWKQHGGEVFGADRELSVDRIRIAVRRKDGENEEPAEREPGTAIGIDRIQVALPSAQAGQSEEAEPDRETRDPAGEAPAAVDGSGQEEELSAKMRELRRIFAEVLGIEETRVEVVYGGGR